MLQCDKCDGAITDGSKFCPHCGDPVTEADKPEKIDKGKGVASVQITFGESSASNYDAAVEICKNIPTYEERQDGTKIQHYLELPITEVELILRIYELIGSIKSFRMLIDGNAAKKSDLVYYGVGCYRNRQKAYDRQQYCFGERYHEYNLWGCKRLNMPLTEWSEWLQYGSLDKNGVWHFDKERIKHELEKGIHENNLCPVLDRKGVINTLEALPKSVDPRNDPNWDYKTEYKETRDGWKEVATGVRPILERASRYIQVDYSPEWKMEQDDSYPTETINISVEDAQSEEGEEEQGYGCSTVLLVSFLVVLIIVILSAVC